MRIRTDKLLHKTLLLGIIAILVLVPFHAFITVWLSSFLGHYVALRLWKEALLMVLLCVAALVILRNNTVWQNITQRRYMQFLLLSIILYALLHIGLSVWAFVTHRIDPTAIAYSLISNNRFLLFFIVCVVAGIVWRDWLRAQDSRLLLIPAAIVVVFGLLQFFILPVDFLKHFGYGADTIQPYIAVDEKIEYARVQSTTRGPNPLGAYLVIVLAAVVALIVAQRKHRVWHIIAALVLVVVLYATYSRSAYLGAVLAIAVTIFVSIRSAKARNILVIGGIATLIVLSAGLFLLRDNDTVQNVVFHTDEHSLSETSSNESRAGAMQSAVSDIAHHPLGEGPGSAGPASIYNDDAAKISENYFLQIGQEVGVLGMIVFIAINVFVAVALWSVRFKNPLAVALLASLVGVSLINMMSHAWADDTLAYIWWGFAGIVIGAPASSVRTKESHETKTN